MQTASKKVINGWAMYDWANSVYNLVITSTIFPAYYEAMTKDTPGKNGVTFLGRNFVNTSLYNYTLAAAFLIVAMLSPILSSVADYKGNKKSFMNFFLTMGSIACAMLFFFKGPSSLGLGIACTMVACIGFWGSLVFYNSFLPEIAAPQDRDRVSAKGFAMGYIGSVILQIICFVFVFEPQLIGGDESSTIQYRLSFLLVGIWWWLFGQFSLSRLPKSIPTGYGNKKNILTNGYKELGKVWRQLIHLSVLKRFLFSFFFYNMGVQTVMLAATLYGTKELQIPTTNLIISILIIQIIAIPGAYGASKISEKIGNFKTLILCIIIWILLCIGGYMIPTKGINEFYMLAFFVGFVMGGIQSLSRSTYSKLMPETKDTTAFFSFYDVTEKMAIVIGMFSFGYITEITGSQRNSVLALIVFFLIGLAGLIIALNKQNKLLRQ
ncbi:MAG: MFS transporter [Bacteroidota bacterium]